MMVHEWQEERRGRSKPKPKLAVPWQDVDWKDVFPKKSVPCHAEGIENSVILLLMLLLAMMFLTILAL